MLVYYMDVSQLDINQTQHSVSLDRIKKTARYIHQKDKKLSIGAELLLKYSLNQIDIFNPVISHDSYGKPFLVNHPRVHFNLSHSEEYVACAVSDSPVGVDIERIHEIELDIARHYFFGSEYHYIQNSANKERAFFQFWVLKESYMKMTGLGFRLGLDEFFIDIQNRPQDKGTRIRVKTSNENSGGAELADKQPEFGVWSVAGDD
ncbi:MAG: 4'-phosphopantetheinyl transferase superfamily protein, partial [Methanobacterium sp.]|nr:4'-phosphopantetheinyl transferase superfamily protein [Methanobacterium sp.]